MMFATTTLLWEALAFQKANILVHLLTTYIAATLAARWTRCLGKQGLHR